MIVDPILSRLFGHLPELYDFDRTWIHSFSTFEPLSGRSESVRIEFKEAGQEYSITITFRKTYPETRVDVSCMRNTGLEFASVGGWSFVRIRRVPKIINKIRRRARSRRMFDRLFNSQREKQ